MMGVPQSESHCFETASRLIVIRSPIGLRNRWGRSRRPVLAVGFLNLRAHFLESFAFIHHLHHVTRDAYADVSSKAHSIEDRLCRC